jgi:apolipoprotein N-acyltransferase
MPLLVGAPMGRFFHGSAVRWESTNSAALIDGKHGVIQRYDKLRLVPFGEFVPGETRFPWLRDLLPPIGTFIPGKHPIVFSVPLETSGLTLPLSVLICFEDVFPDLARRFVHQGARALVVITNDAWFGRTAAPYQHAQASVFRAVELRVPVVRAANTGWSGCFDAAGRRTASVQGPGGRETFVEGWASCGILPGRAITVYSIWGDWLPVLCVLMMVLWWIRRSRRGPAVR